MDRREYRLSSVAEMWEGYAAAVMPKDAPPTQVQETRRAFYAGVWALLTEFRGIGESDVPEHVGVEHLEAIKAECERFTLDVLTGKC